MGVPAAAGRDDEATPLRFTEGRGCFRCCERPYTPPGISNTSRSRGLGHRLDQLVGGRRPPPRTRRRRASPAEALLRPVRYRPPSSAPDVADAVSPALALTAARLAPAAAMAEELSGRELALLRHDLVAFGRVPDQLEHTAPMGAGVVGNSIASSSDAPARAPPSPGTASSASRTGRSPPCLPRRAARTGPPVHPAREDVGLP